MSRARGTGREKKREGMWSTERKRRGLFPVIDDLIIKPDWDGRDSLLSHSFHSLIQTHTLSLSSILPMFNTFDWFWQTSIVSIMEYYLLLPNGLTTEHDRCIFYLPISRYLRENSFSLHSTGTNRRFLFLSMIPTERNRLLNQNASALQSAWDNQLHGSNGQLQIPDKLASRLVNATSFMPIARWSDWYHIQVLLKYWYLSMWFLRSPLEEQSTGSAMPKSGFVTMVIRLVRELSSRCKLITQISYFLLASQASGERASITYRSILLISAGEKENEPITVHDCDYVTSQIKFIFFWQAHDNKPIIQF
jgi:hypothetical protein